MAPRPSTLADLQHLHFTLSGRGEEVPRNLTQVISDTPIGTLTSRKTITTFYKFAQLNSDIPIH